MLQTTTTTALGRFHQRAAGSSHRVSSVSTIRGREFESNDHAEAPNISTIQYNTDNAGAHDDAEEMSPSQTSSTTALLSSSLQLWWLASKRCEEGIEGHVAGNDDSLLLVSAVDLYRRGVSASSSGATSAENDKEVAAKQQEPQYQQRDWRFWTCVLSEATALLDREEEKEARDVGLGRLRITAVTPAAAVGASPTAANTATSSTHQQVHYHQPPPRLVGRGRSTTTTLQLATWEIVWNWCTTPTTTTTTRRHSTTTPSTECESNLPPAPQAPPPPPQAPPPPGWFLAALVSHMAVRVLSIYESGDSSDQQQQLLSTVPPYLLLLLVNQVRWLLTRIASVSFLLPPSKVNASAPEGEGVSAGTKTTALDIGDEQQEGNDDQERSSRQSATTTSSFLNSVLTPRLEELALDVIGAAASSMTDDLLCFSLALARNLCAAITTAGGQQSKPQHYRQPTTPLPSIAPYLSRMRTHASSLRDTVHRQWMSLRTCSALLCSVVDGSLAPVLQFALQDAPATLLVCADSSDDVAAAAGDDDAVENANERKLVSSLRGWLRTVARECDAVILLLGGDAPSLGGDNYAAAAAAAEFQRWCPNLSTLRRLLAVGSN